MWAYKRTCRDSDQITPDEGTRQGCRNLGSMNCNFSVTFIKSLNQSSVKPCLNTLLLVRFTASDVTTILYSTSCLVLQEWYKYQTQAHCTTLDLKFLNLLQCSCFLLRITEKRLSLTRPAHMIGRYTMLSHSHAEGEENPER